jgi:hypothetical protein
MKAVPIKKKKVAIVVRRKPFDKVDEQTKIKIVEEIKTGMISCLGASRKYRIPRNTIKPRCSKSLTSNHYACSLQLQKAFIYLS